MTTLATKCAPAAKVGCSKLNNLLATPPRQGLMLSDDELHGQLMAIGLYHEARGFLSEIEEVPTEKVLEKCFDELRSSNMKREMLDEPIMSLPALFAAVRYELNRKKHLDQVTAQPMYGPGILDEKIDRSGSHISGKYRAQVVESLRKTVLEQAEQVALGYFKGAFASDTRKYGLTIGIYACFMRFTEPRGDYRLESLH